MKSRKRKQAIMLGVRIDNTTRAEALEFIVDVVADRKSSYIVTPNPAILLQAERDAALHRALNGSSLSLADGAGVVLASYALRQPLRERVTGVDLSVDLARESAEHGWRVGVWSPAPGVAAQAVRILEEAFLGFNGVAFRDEPTASVDILLVGLGAPHQEKWMFDCYNRGIATVMIGVGGAIDLIAGVRPRAPRVLCFLGLEWLWRLLLEPRRHWSRVWQSLVVFPWKLLRHHQEAQGVL